MNRLTVRHVAVALYYLSHFAGTRVALFGALLKQLNHLVTGADVAWEAQIGSGLRLYHPTGVVIGPDVVMGNDCVIQQGVTLGGFGGDEQPERTESPLIGDRVRVGAGARILGPIKVGDDAVVGANAVVLCDVPAGFVAVGVPARARPASTGDGE